MSYNGSGTFNINTTGQPVVAGTIISAATFNALTADLATGLTTALTKDGQTTATARIPFAQGINSTLSTDASSVSTGSIFTAGGVGIAKKLYVGTDANVAGSITSTLVTDASSVSTGAIITAGGVGIAKKLYVGTDANIGGTLAVTGVATFSASPVYSSLTASSAVATDASKALVSVANTGTGSNVLATAPTIASLNLTTALTLAGAAGTNGQVLTSAGSGLPTWAVPSAGALTLLSTVTASASATVDIETTFSSTYDNYLIVGSGIFGSTNEAIKVRLKIGGSYLTAGYDAVNMYKANSDAALLYNDSTNAASAALVVVNTDANSRSGITMTIFEASSAARKTVLFDNSYTETTNNSRFVGSIGNRTAGALSGVRIFGTGTLSGTFRLYGIANS